MNKIPMSELASRLESVPVFPGEHWRHITNDDAYVVVCLAIFTGDLQPVVVYERDGVAFARPAAEWLGKFERVG